MHPHGTRFATAGSDHKVKVWNLLPVLDVEQELSSDTPKLLATLADHFGPVNVARFSHNGRFLASGAGATFMPLMQHIGMLCKRLPCCAQRVLMAALAILCVTDLECTVCRCCHMIAADSSS